MKHPVYITTTLPYVNADPHIGHALEFVQADIFARHERLLGKEVFLNTGTDEHGQKVFEKAEEAKVNPQEYVDGYAERFNAFCKRLDISFDNFIRTTNPDHKKAAQVFWTTCFDAGDIYKKLYKIKYCVGCELEKTESELVEGRCDLHSNKELEIREEENYFFRFSNYQSKLLDFYKANPSFVVPDYRFNEIKAFVERGLEDFSISRVKEKMSWGVPVPNDPDHVMYVWFDALINYISTIGWPNETYKDWWPVIQFAGKDNLRQQAAMWQAMLMSAGVETSKQIVIHGFINIGGVKMSKSLGNVVNPNELIEEYGTDAVRYYLARHMHPFEDSDYTAEKFEEAYTANLVNGIGNLTNRILKMSSDHLETPVTDFTDSIIVGFDEAILEYNVQHAADLVWASIGKIDQHIQETEPFKLVKVDKEKAVEDISDLVKRLHNVAKHLEVFMPATSEKIMEAIKHNKKPDEPLFPRK